MNKENIIRHVESAFLTFSAFFLVDLGTSIHNLSTQPIETITWGVIGAAIVSAARTAVKLVWEKWVNPVNPPTV